MCTQPSPAEPSQPNGADSLKRFTITVLIFCMILLLECHAATYYWDADGAGSTATGGAGTWNANSVLFRLDSTTGALGVWPGLGGDNDLFLSGTAGNVALGNAFSVNDLTVAPTGGTSYALSGASGSINLAGAAAPVISVASGSTLTISTQLTGAAGFTKSGAGTLVLDNASDNLTGGVMLQSGTLQIGTSTTAGPTLLRATAVDIASGATLMGGGITVTTGPLLRVGTLSGSGSIDVGNGSVFVANFGPANPLSPGTASTYFGSGTVFSGTVKSLGLTFSGANGEIALPGGRNVSMQTFNGNTGGFNTGTFRVFSGSGLTLSGGGTGIGVIQPTSMEVRGGALVLDNLSANPTSGTRIRSSASITFAGASLVLVGNSSGSTQLIDKLTLTGGASVFSAVQTSSTAATTLSISDLTRSATTTSTVDFRGINGTLGSTTSAAPKIKVSTFPSGEVAGGWATVNGTDFAYYDSTNGVRAATYTSTTSTMSGSGNGITFHQITGSVLKADATTFNTVGLKITPDGESDSLALTTGSINTSAVLLTGANDYTISSSGAGGLTSTATRYIGVADPDATLNIGAVFRGNGKQVVKYGDGFLNLTGNNVGSVTSLVINAGTARVALGNTGSLPTDGTASLTLRGGVLEIANGGNGTGASADLKLGLGEAAGTINWASSSASFNFDAGGGGFSAFGSNASVSIGGATPATLQWNSTYFVQTGYALTFGSTKADHRITLLNPVNLNDPTATDYVAREIRVLKNPTITSGDEARISGAISGSANVDLLKTGAGVLQLTGNNTFTGNTIVQQGTLQVGASDGTGAGGAGALGQTSKIIVNSTLTAANGGSVLLASNRATLLLDGDATITNRINDNAAIVLDGGIFNTNGRSETVGTLTLLHTDAILDMGTIASGLSSNIIRFADSSGQTWEGSLSVWNWSGSLTGGGTDQLFFGNSASGLRADQLAKISFYGDDGRNFLGTGTSLSSGELVPVPEPSTFLSGCVAAALACWPGRRHTRQKAAVKS